MATETGQAIGKHVRDRTGNLLDISAAALLSLQKETLSWQMEQEWELQRGGQGCLHGWGLEPRDWRKEQVLETRLGALSF